LDVFQMQDLTDRLRPETLGVPAVTIAYGTGEWGFDTVWLPVSATDYFSESPWNVWSIIPPTPVPARLDRTGEPDASLNNGEGGVRMTWNGQTWDLAVMAARTRDHSPSYLDLSRDEVTLVFTPRYERYWMTGASMVRAVGSLILRGEALYALYDGESTFVKDGIRGVLGVETRGELGARTRYSVILQYAIDSTAPNGIQQSEGQLSSPFRLYRHAATAAVLTSLGDRYDCDLRFFADVEHLGVVASAKLRYRPMDGFAMWLAGDVLAGGDGTWLGRLQNADRILVGVEIHAK
jgi:hypothetical protein